MNDPATLYFVAIVPPEPIRTEVQAFKQIAAELFSSARALRSPAHITLVPPFRITRQERLECALALSEVARQLDPFEVALSGFDAFKPRVIFVDVMMSPELKQLQEKCTQSLESALKLNPSTRPYHAHMTVAFKDLRRKQFEPAWVYYSRLAYERCFEVQDIVLLKHTRSGWIEDAKYELRPAR